MLAHDLETPPAQVDLLVQRRALLIVVEVKTRREVPRELALGPAQSARLARAANWLLARRGARFDSVRIDLVSVVIPRRAPWWPRIRHYPGALGEVEN
ncbi:MAG: YraN family protein [Planctomycetes bacterium]|nr:YraN family protein [Planctomycetota bacterium]